MMLAQLPAGEAARRLQDVLEEDRSLVLKTGAPFHSALHGGAVFSPCERYRYLLWRVWSPKLPIWTFGMLNPSTADHEQLDPTVTRCSSRASRSGAGGLIVWNLFAFRATDPADMKAAEDPVGAANDRAITFAVRNAALNVAAWGSHGPHRGRDEAVKGNLARLGVPLHALAFTSEGRHPRHPLYLSNHLIPKPWSYAE